MDQKLIFFLFWLWKCGKNIYFFFLLGKIWKLIRAVFFTAQSNNGNLANQNAVTKLSRHRPLILKPLALGTLLLIHGQERFTIRQGRRKVQIFWGASSIRRKGRIKEEGFAQFIAQDWGPKLEGPMDPSTL